MEQKNKSAMWAIIAVAVIVLGGFGIYALTQNSDEVKVTEQTTKSEEVMEEKKSDIVVLAINTDALSTLVTAVKAAGLVETLQGAGPYTVLAPTNDAFAALPEGTLASLLLPENKEQLAGILTYHVISGDVMASDLTNGQVVPTVNGGTLTVEINEAGVYFVDAKGGKAKVVTADVDASNGTVHVIDAVLLP